jgi:hypothetical protein
MSKPAEENWFEEGFDFDSYEKEVVALMKEVADCNESSITTQTRMQLKAEIAHLKEENKNLHEERSMPDDSEEEMLYVQVLDLKSEIDRLKGEIYDLSFEPMKKEIIDLEDKIYALENMTKEELVEKIQWYSDRTKPFHPNALNIDGDEETQKKVATTED